MKIEKNIFVRYHNRMNIAERKVLLFRFTSSFLLLIPIGLMALSIFLIINLNPEEIVLLFISLFGAAAFNIFEIILLLKGWKKESHLYKIAFNTNGTINNIPIFAVGAGTIFGIFLTSLGTAVYFVREENTIKSAMLVVLSIGAYLLINCIIYFIYLIMYKKRELDLRELIK